MGIAWWKRCTCEEAIQVEQDPCYWLNGCSQPQCHSSEGGLQSPGMSCSGFTDGLFKGKGETTPL